MILIRSAKLGALVLVLFAPLCLHAATYYVAPTGGSDTAAGTEAAPFATVGRAQTAAVAGDTVFVRGGTFTFSGTQGTSGVVFNKSGRAGLLINYFAFPGETPVFDLFGLLPQARVTGFDVTGSYIHIRGMEVRGVQQIITGDSWGVRVQGGNNIIEALNVHHNEAPGIFISGGANNLILNCDSHHNYDPLESGGNADGFGCHSPGGGNVLSGNRSYANSDDGFDFINASGSCTVEKSIAFRNGYQPDTMTTAGNGVGFKSGGYGTDTSTFPATIPRHTVRMNVAFNNRSQGFYSNHHPGGIDFFNNTSFGNSQNFNMLADVGASSHMLRNNVAMAPGGTITALTGGTDTFNSWTLTVTVSAADFMSTAEADALAPRAADGSLTSATFMHLVAGSDLIDKGTDVGLPFVGTAPDLGAFEFGAPIVSPGTGGAGGAVVAGTGGAGAGGRAGTGGATGGRGGPGTGGAPTTGSGGSVVTGTGGAIVSGSGGAGAGIGGRTGSTGGAGPTTSTGGSGVIPGAAGTTTGGCGCSVTEGPARGGWTLVSLLLAAVWIRSRAPRLPRR